MTVEELIHELSGYPHDAKVNIYCTFDAGWCEAGGDIIFTNYHKEENILSLINDEG